MDKQQLRQYIRSQKRAMTPQAITEKSALLAEKLRAHPLYRQARCIYGYLPYNQEVRTDVMLAQALLEGKRVAVPRVEGDAMRFYYITDITRVAKGYCGIPEPLGDEPLAVEADALVLMPGLAFDSQGGRMGYGGGFYDKFLQTEPGHPTLALCYGFQMVERVPREEHDKAVDAVLFA